ncbi:adenosylhomocysteinase [Methanocella sp. CWC-04]|uniref:S-inosyl-L-homocysteine hydrolase n=1 Tax=Methanooceanicella nereidis TaxID=2052831 RepID=A0AAP2W565_9EURY|nr:adenosylhomocysteinase [Methanocella sp. CWC-04]MCD1295170.1 adenosylhomocysteinase [Methanocella sp. CWC-04]
MKEKDYAVKDIKLAKQGQERIEWARRHMPVLGKIKEEFEKAKPLKGVNVIACLHVTVETANLIEALIAGGANVALTASNPLSTQDDVAAALAKKGVKVYAIRGEDEKQYYENIESALKIKPNITLDDGADVIATVHSKHKEYLKSIYGGCEETTTGVIRLRAMAKDKALKYPVVAVNDAETKMMFDNRYGTGQSTLHGIINATNVLLAGKTVVVVGYGWCGRGCASRAKGMGSNVVVVEINARKALEAAMDGFQVMDMKEAAKVGDIFITVTGDIAVIRGEHFKLMKDQAIVCNSGHFNVELALDELKKMSKSVTTVKADVDEYLLKGGNRIYVLGEGRLVNLACAFGHPPEVMDMSFANQALCVKYIAENHKKLKNDVYKVPEEIDTRVAEMKLESMGIKLEKLTKEQEKYLSSWSMGT